MQSTIWNRRSSWLKRGLALLAWVLMGASLLVSRAVLAQELAPAMPLQDAIKTGDLDAWAEPIGIGFRQPMVRLHLLSRTEAETITTIPLGTKLAAPSASFADLVVADTITVTVPAHMDLEVVAFSLAYDRGFPSATDTYSYTVGPVIDSSLAAHLAEIAAQPIEKRKFGAQLAVWAWANDISLETLVGQLLVPPLPEDIALAQRWMDPTVSATTPTDPVSHPEEPGGNTSSQTDDPAGVTDPPVRSPAGCPGLLFLSLLMVGLIAAGAWLANRRLSPQEAQAPLVTVNDQTAPAKADPPPARGTADPAGGNQGQPSAPGAGSTPQPVDALAGSGPVDQAPVGAGSNLELVATRGPLSGTRWSLPEHCILSRGAVNWLVIPDQAISVPHVALDMAGDSPRIKDLNSKNGVTLDGQHLGKGFSVLNEGQIIGIGSLLLTLKQKQLQVTHGALAGKGFALSSGMVAISRERLPVIVLGAQDRAISDLHVSLNLSGQTLCIKDLNSSNGTHIDGNRVQEEILWPGARLQLGGSEFRLQTRFDKYTLLALLGEGGMARVYLAEDEQHAKWALKIPRESHRDLKTRFIREAQNHSYLRHPHIVAVHETGEANGYPYVAMQYINGGTLQARLKEGEPLPLKVALRIAREVAEALAYAYSTGVMFHRDIKPSNILLDHQDTAYLTDFGIAKALEDIDLTNSGDVLGTVYYMSPEQAQGNKTLDQRTDIYSLGVVLYQMLSGAVPFDTTSSKPAILLKHISEPPPPLREANPNVPVQVEEIVLKCLAKSPDDRYQTAHVLGEALERAGGG